MEHLTAWQGAPGGRALAAGAPPAHHGRVAVLVTVAAALAVGIALIALAGRGRGARAPVGPVALGELAWVREGGAPALERLLVALLGAMGYEAGATSRGEGWVDLQAVDPAPIRGGRLHVRGLLAAPGEPLSADEVRAVVDAARGDGAGKAVLATLGALSGEARAAAEGAPVDLLDEPALAALVRRHLPQVAATRRV